MGRLVIDGNRVYEVDEECMRMKNRMSENENHQKKETYASLKQKSQLKPGQIRTDRTGI